MKKLTLRKKCPYSELFWSTFSRLWTEYGEAERTDLKLILKWLNWSSFHTVMTILLPLNSSMICLTGKGMLELPFLNLCNSTLETLYLRTEFKVTGLYLQLTVFSTSLSKSGLNKLLRRAKPLRRARFFGRVHFAL